jgi:hypothetical protein
MELKSDRVVENMTDDEIKAEYALVEARLDEIEHVIDPALQQEIDALREYQVLLKGTVLARR